MQKRVKVKWDIFVRIFHWSLVLAFATTYLTGEYDVELLHSWLGYAIVFLIIFRLLWGFVGSFNARFSTFSYGPAETLAYISGVLRNNPKHYESHNPAGALMVFGLLAALAVLVISGLIYEGWGEYEGPLWQLNIMITDNIGHLARTIHRCLPEIMLVMVGLHLLGVVVATFQHKENFVKAMITGRG